MFVKLALPQMQPPLQCRRRRPQVGGRYLHPLVEVHDQCQSRPPCRFTPPGGGNAGCVQVEVITKAGKSVTRALALPFPLDIMHRAVPLWRPSIAGHRRACSAACTRPPCPGGCSSSSAWPGGHSSPLRASPTGSGKCIRSRESRLNGVREDRLAGPIEQA
jgi:hypothetical protein